MSHKPCAEEWKYFSPAFDPYKSVQSQRRNHNIFREG
jgi:hypothetical protein